MIDLTGIPLLNEEQTKELFAPTPNDEGFFQDFIVQPKFELLPYVGDKTPEQMKKYLFRDLNEDFYLTGLVLMSNKWVNNGFCARILRNCGLVLECANPAGLIQRYQHDLSNMIYIEFTHITKQWTDFEMNMTAKPSITE